MISMICDVCERPIRETGYVCDLVEARMVHTSDTRPRMVERGQILSLYMCPACAARVQRTIHTLRARAAGADDSANGVQQWASDA